MNQFEKVEKLREKADVTYEEARAALDACNWDMLDAIVYLEKLGKVHGFQSTRHTTHYEEPEHFEQTASQYTEEKSSFKNTVKKFFKWCSKMIKKGNEHHFDVKRKGEGLISIPITILVVLILVAFWAVIILLIVGLFFGCHYSLRGPDIKTDTINNAMGKASAAAENIKNDIKNNFNE
ncbi:DUF4342 domain-containing protein [Parasporobacterium paucivorans]|uniref:DUF4342 domain-containing protein n=1 Tax=Parasporobacterium paucivorans DSM 15970 TaxID=1122934 RepID=A0A1M6HJR3_9FIRM|nr:DUF4342 domain-containing protein [Parasporobacterium paucivorans]SHJ22476.1 protein of unknown function [Parasporobacterium paucivorans DSM 15970]